MAEMMNAALMYGPGDIRVKQMPIAVGSHPSGAFEMAIMDALCAIWLPIRVDCKNDGDGLAPTGLVRCGVK